MHPCSDQFKINCVSEKNVSFQKISIPTPYMGGHWKTQGGRGLEGLKSGLSKVAGCQQKSPSTWLVSASYSASHFFMDGHF